MNNQITENDTESQLIKNKASLKLVYHIISKFQEVYKRFPEQVNKQIGIHIQVEFPEGSSIEYQNWVIDTLNKMKIE